MPVERRQIESVLGSAFTALAPTTPVDWDALRTTFDEIVRERQAESGLAEDRAVLRREHLAFDRKDSGGESVRTVDADGRLHIRITNISKACVNPYLGKEIPNWKGLGLDPEQIYRLFRDPEELKKSASTFNNLQLLSQHKPVNVEDHQGDLTIGSTGTDAVFEYPYLKNSLVVWVKPAIDAIDADELKELSSAYRYTADMTPGVFEGERYDGVMRDLVGNHVALVEEGRAGPDVVVGDSTQELKMAKLVTIASILVGGALGQTLLPRLAQDAKLVLPSILGLDAKTFKANKTKISDEVRKVIDGKLKDGFALDATMDDVNKLLDKLDDGQIVEKAEKVETVDEAMTDANAAVPMVQPEATDDDPVAKIKAMLEAAGVAPEIIAKIDEICGSAAAAPPAPVNGDDPPPFKDKPDVGGTGGAAKKPPALDADPEKKDEEDEKVDKKAMDEAIKKASDDTAKKVREEQTALRDAERAVRPYVGELSIACDSAEQVYRHALKALGVETKGVHPSALPTILQMQKKIGEKAPRVIAQDGANGDAEGFAARHANTSRIAVIG